MLYLLLFIDLMYCIVGVAAVRHTVESNLQNFTQGIFRKQSFQPPSSILEANIASSYVHPNGVSPVEIYLPLALPIIVKPDSPHFTKKHEHAH